MRGVNSACRAVLLHRNAPVFEVADVWFRRQHVISGLVRWACKEGSMRTATLTRLAFIVALVVGLAQFAPTPVGSATLGGNWTLEMRALGCPRGYAGFDFAADCTEPVPGMACRIRSDKATDWVDFVSGGDGTVAVNVTGPVTPHLAMVADSPGFAQINANCTRQNGDLIEHEYDGFLTIGPVGQDGVVICDWYFVPWQPRDAMLTLRVFNCPPGMTVDTLAPDQCIATTTGFEVAITSTQGPMEPYRLADAALEGTAYTWNLGPAPPPLAGGAYQLGHYTISEVPLPAGYDSYVVIGDVIRGVTSFGGYRIDVSGENTPAELALYNFSTGQAVDAWSLTVRSLSCPPGYSGDAWGQDCTALLPGVAFTSLVLGEGAEYQPFDTGESGSVTLDLDGAALGNAITATVPEGVERAAVSCTENGGQESGFRFDGTTLVLYDIAAGDQVLCDWYFVPFADEAPIESLTPTPAAVEGRPAHIHRGTCGRLRRDPHYDLSDLTANEGKWVGSRQTTIAEMSITVIDASIDDLTSVRWSINVHGDEETNQGYLVCGEIGGVPSADGSLAIGLREVNGSGYTGTAYLMPDPSDPGRTQVWVFISLKLAEEERLTPVASPVASPVGTPAVQEESGS
jgi:hypothetical protein